MAILQQIAVVSPNAASNTSLSSNFNFSPEYDRYGIFAPPLFANTASCGIEMLGYPAASSFPKASGTTYATFYAVVLSGEKDAWSINSDVGGGGGFFECPALKEIPGLARLRFTNTMTANTNFIIYGYKE